MKTVIPIKWISQHEGIARRKATDGYYGSVNGDTLFFIYHTSDPYTKGWNSWDKNCGKPFPEDSPVKYRSHWNVWLYFGSGSGRQVGRALKNSRQAKRTARRLLLQKINAVLR